MLLTEDMLGSNQGKFNIHLGTEEQLPDNIIGKYKAAGTYPAYRGLCYVVFEDFPLEKFGNRIPNFSFEVRRTVKFRPAVEDKITEIILIPGAGEFVYSDLIYSKQHGINIDACLRGYGKKEYINMHNYAGRANMPVALDQMAKTLPNLEWVAVVVTWFATSSSAGNCRIVPKVEFHCNNTKIIPHEWTVAGKSRHQVEEVLRFENNAPTYGGTPSDDTVISICRELKKRGYKIMLYPMIFVDEIKPDPKPWRGRITANNRGEIDSWFTQKEGYNNFIMHYAELAKNQVDAFIIGSEMVGLTGFTDNTGSYPAVNHFIKLAGMAKAKLGQQTLVTYAADWSEYHHTSGGWFNLDPLWACPDIDFIGIDSYFPLTEDLPQTAITEELIKKGWESGEGWDYYYDRMRTKKTYFAKDSPAAPHKYAWKNLQHWWTTTHQDPNGKTTKWQPKMKPVWFTEFGFPSVDGCSNQPNVFYDPTSVESYFPRGSNGRVNFFAQRQALNATLDYLKERTENPGLEQLVPKRFVWTYDARPFPFWPDFKQVWQDGILWPTGHWINGKLGASGLGAIIAEILETVGLKPSDYDVSRLQGDVQGYIILEHLTAREAIEQLQSAYFFDSVESDGILKFIPRLAGTEAVAEIKEDELVPSNNKDICETLDLSIAQELELPRKVSVTHIDQQQNYDLLSVQSQRQTAMTREQINFSLPIVLSNQLAKQIADITLYNAWQERINYGLTLPSKYAYLEPTDIISIHSDSSGKKIPHKMRIVKTDNQRSGQMKITAVSHNVAMYDFYSATVYLDGNYEIPEPVAGTEIMLIDAPPLPADNNEAQSYLKIAVVPDGSNWQGAVIYQSIDDGYDYRLLSAAQIPSIVGITLNPLPAASPLVFDYGSEIIVQLLFSGALCSVSELSLLNGANSVMIGDELIQFQNSELIGDNKYRLTKLLRGRQGTEWAIGNHKAGDRFIFLNSGIITCNISSELIGKPLLYKAVTVGKTLAEVEPVTFTHKAVNLKPFAPVHLKALRDENGDITINWIRRSRINNSWSDHSDVPIGEEQEQYRIEIRNGDQIIRTLEAEIPTVTYTAEQQQADFSQLEKPYNLTATVYQLSSQIGKGYGASIELNF
jgi:hypothetical protein